MWVVGAPNDTTEQENKERKKNDNSREIWNKSLKQKGRGEQDINGNKQKIEDRGASQSLILTNCAHSFVWIPPRQRKKM